MSLFKESYRSPTTKRWSASPISTAVRRESRAEIVRAIDEYGGLEIVAGADGLRMRVERHQEAQCLFALVSRKGRQELGGGLIYLRTNAEELVVVHIALADRYSRNRRVALRLIMRLVRSVRAAAKRLRGVNRVSVLYRGNPLATINLRSKPTTRQEELAVV